MCPDGNKPSGEIINNTFITCPGVPGIWANPEVKGCADNITVAGNTTSTVDTVVAQPQVSFEPPAPSSKALSVKVPVNAATNTANATLRYTLDGSRPTLTSPVLPAAGIVLTWPGPNVAFNVVGFHPSLQPSVTNGAVIERALYAPRADATGKGLVGNFEPLDVVAGALRGHGWVVDTALEKGGW